MKNVLLLSIILMLFLNNQPRLVCNEPKTDGEAKQSEMIEQANKAVAENEGTSSFTQKVTEDVLIGCMDFKNFPVEIIIQTQEEYSEFLDRRLAVPDCNDYKLPKIDFLQKSLLGYKTSASGCQQPNYSRTINCDESKNTCIYSISIEEIGACKKGWPNMNWVIVTKIPDSFIIKFTKTN